MTRKKKRRQFSREFKEEAVRLVTQKGVPLKQGKPPVNYTPGATGGSS